MGMFDFSGMEPDQLKALVSELQDHMGTNSHPDKQEDNEWIQPLVQAVQYLAERNDALEKRLEALENFIQKDFIGGLQDFYSEKERGDGVGALKAKYEGDFKPFMPLLKQINGDEYDPFGDMFDHIKGHYDDDDFDADDYIDELLDEFENKIEELRKALSNEDNGEEAEPEGTEEGEPEGEMIIEKSTSRFPKNIDLEDLLKGARRGVKAG